jgi:hypothetical protein
MKYLDSYQFELSINNSALDVNPLTYSFSMKDSINKLYSELDFSIDDTSGMFQEALMFTEGFNLYLKYGDKVNVLEGKYIINNDDLMTTYSNDSIAGILNVNCLHEYYDKQEVKSDGSLDTISNIISTLAGEYGFNSTNVDAIDSADYWYRPMLTQEKFIYEILLPNSYSNLSFDSPFYCFIDNNNNFNYKSYYTMMSTISTEKDFILQVTNPSSLRNNTILEFSKVRTGSTFSKKFRKRFLFSRNRKTGELTTDNDKISQYPSNSSQMTSGLDVGYLPIVSDGSLDTGNYFLYYDEEEPGPLGGFNGRKINSMRETFALERVLIITPLNPSVICGKTINIQVPIKVQNSSKLSYNYSGKYLVEESEHVWNGKLNKSFSKFLLSRKFVNISSESKVKSKFLKGS